MRFDRIAQVAARYIGIFLVWCATAAYSTLNAGEVPEGILSAIATFEAAITVFVAAVLSIIVSEVIHWFNNGGFWRAPKAKGTIAPKDALKPKSK